jgi:group I intron endonuclease
MKITGIYKIQSIIKPERSYIGSALNISDRWRRHLGTLKRNCHKNIKLQNHFNKYGETDLLFSILLGCEKSDLLKLEQYFIDSYNPWFNICKIAGSNLGIRLTEKTKQLLSSSLKGNRNRVGVIISDETKQKMSLAKRNMSDNTKVKMSLAKKNSKHSKEHNRKIGDSKRGKKRKPFTPEHLKNMSECKKKRLTM